jgi:PD-(D/E)XK nuclease superfamily protein
MLKVYTPLSAELERLAHDTIGCCIAVHRALGPGLVENVYSRALGVELRANGIKFEREKPFAVTYRGELICEQRRLRRRGSNRVGDQIGRAVGGRFPPAAIELLAADEDARGTADKLQRSGAQERHREEDLVKK